MSQLETQTFKSTSCDLMTQRPVRKGHRRGIAKTQTKNTKTQWLCPKKSRHAGVRVPIYIIIYIYKIYMQKLFVYNYVYIYIAFLGITQSTQKSLRIRITYRYYRLPTSSGAASLPAASWHRAKKHAKQTSVLSISHTNKIKIKLKRLQVHTY